MNKILELHKKSEEIIKQINTILLSDVSIYNKVVRYCKCKGLNIPVQNSFLYDYDYIEFYDSHEECAHSMHISFLDEDKLSELERKTQEKNNKSKKEHHIAHINDYKREIGRLTELVSNMEEELKTL